MNKLPIKALYALMAALAALGIYITESHAEDAQQQDAPAAVVQPNAEQTPFSDAVAEAESYFTPVSADLTGSGPLYRAAIGAKDGLRPGMRLFVYRKGRPFVHPITGETVGAAETRIGTIEATDVSESTGSFRVVDGEAAAGDAARIASLRVRALFFQSEDFDWDLSEEYYYWLKASKRFEIMDTAPAKATDEEVAARARALDAEIAIKLEPVAMKPQPVFIQKVIWAHDAKVLVEREVRVTEVSFKTSKLGEEYFKPGVAMGTTELTVPYSVDLIGLGDIDCDGADEMVLSRGTSLIIYKADVMLKPWLGAKEPHEIVGPAKGRFVWLDVADIDADGCAEVIAASLKDAGGIESYVYKHATGPEFKLIWKAGYFLRALDGRLIGQRFDAVRGGYKAEPFVVDMNTPDGEGAQLGLPVKGVGLYGFQPVGPEGQRFYAAYDAAGKLALYDSTGLLLWSSPDTLGRPARFFTHGADTVGNAQHWSVPDRLVATGRQVLTVKKTFWAESAKGLGVKSSQVLGLAEPGAMPRLDVVVNEVPDEVLDMGMSGGMLFVLSNSYSMSFENLIRGRKLFRTKLFIYKAEL